MSWVKLDDTFWSHPKLERLSDKAFRLYIRGLGYCSQHLTDGVIDVAGIRTLGQSSMSNKTISELTDAGLWIGGIGHYLVNDYLEYNPSRVDVLERRRKEAEKKAAQRAKSNQHPETGRFTA